MAIICPTITVDSLDKYQLQLDNVKDFARRIHIDLMDGEFTPSRSIELDRIYWPEQLSADLHLMYKRPQDCLDQLISLKPSLVIFHAEAEVDLAQFANDLKAKGFKVGLALLQQTNLEVVASLLPEVDHLLIFGGNLGYQGGQADLHLTKKVRQARQLYPGLEIAWDGGVNDQNAGHIVEAGAGVLDVGSFIQASSDPKAAYDKLLVA